MQEKQTLNYGREPKKQKQERKRKAEKKGSKGSGRKPNYAK